MGKNVLIATLGDSPIVVTSMMKALEAKIGIIDELQVIYPLYGKHLIEFGWDMVVRHLEGTCSVTPCALPFSDTNNREISIEFLRVLSGLIGKHEDDSNNVFLSLAGGRKNMSALMAVTCQLFECVRGLYHILDKYENDRIKRNFYSIEELYDLEQEGAHEAKLSPPIEDLTLVEIPYTRLPNGTATALRKYLSTPDFDWDAQIPITIPGEPAAFYHSILREEQIGDQEKNEVYLSKNAYSQFQDLKDPVQKQRFMNCFRSMQDPSLLARRDTKSLRNAKTDCTPFKMGNTAERPFYYRINGKVVVCELAQKNTTYDAICKGRKEVYKKDHPLDSATPINEHSATSMSELGKGSILIAPLGKSPMVVTQTYTLLHEREGTDIEEVILVYPDNSEIHNGVEYLQDAFRAESIDRAVKPNPIETITDIASTEDCQIFFDELVRVIEEVQTNSSDKSIYLSLSGGRKGMAALTLFAAQKANIDAVYHTLITDPDIEKRIEDETTLDKLAELTPKQIAERFFLNIYDKSQFELFRVPVIPIT